MTTMAGFNGFKAFEPSMGGHGQTGRGTKGSKRGPCGGRGVVVYSISRDIMQKTCCL